MRTPRNELERRRINERGRQVLARKAGRTVRPMRRDGYVNMLNKYGSQQDNSEAYRFEREPIIPDMQLTGLYEGNGLFAKIIDTPAEEALKHGFDLNLNNDDLDAFVEEALDDLEWEEKATTAIKWSRLYGGAIIVMLIDDGRGLEEPVDWQNIRSIDELRVFERAIVQPDESSLYQQDYGGKGTGNRVSKFGQPEFYYVSSIYGSFKVHESRCLVFKNGVLPEQSTNSVYRFWGMPDYVRIRRALRETITAHTDSTKLLERSVQAIYSMKGLAEILSTDEGEDNVLKRLQVIDMARGLLNSIAIDSDGESYDFKTFQFSGVADVIDATCNMLSALTNIPQTILFGRSPAGMNATGDSDFESYYNFVERIQKLMLKRNLRNLLDIVFRAGVASGDIEEEPAYKLKFNPLWSLSETEQANVDKTKADTAMVKAQTAQLYVDMQALDPSEVRSSLASDEDFNVEDIISEDDDTDLLESLLGSNAGDMSDAAAAEKNIEENKTPGGAEQTAPAALPEPTQNADAGDDWVTINGTHVLIDENGVAQGGGKLVGKTFESATTSKGQRKSSITGALSFGSEEAADTFFGKRPSHSLRRENREEYDRLKSEYENSSVKTWEQSLQEPESRAIQNYAGPDYSGINGFLRGEMTEKMVDAWSSTSDMSVQDMAKNIQSGIAKFELREPITVYRTCEMDVFESLSQKVGSTFRDNGFTSTTVLNETVASGNVRMEINVPAQKGVGAYIASTLGHPEEHEFLLQRGTEFTVTGVSKSGGNYTIRLDVTGSSPQEARFATRDEVIDRWKRQGLYSENDPHLNDI